MVFSHSGVLDTFGDMPCALLDASSLVENAHPIETAILEDAVLGKNLILGRPFVWSPLARINRRRCKDHGGSGLGGQESRDGYVPRRTRVFGLLPKCEPQIQALPVMLNRLQ